MNGVSHATNPLKPFPISWGFWAANALLWMGYAGSLMIPWLDRYSVLYMLPNKVAIAGTGVAVTGLLRAFYRWAERRQASIAWGLLACVAGALVLDITIVTITQGAEAIPTRFDSSLGSILGGVPVPGRVGQYTILLVAWSLGYHLFRRRTVPDIAETPTDGTLAVSGSTIRARDGSRTFLLQRDEVDWIAADGDYIRLHYGQKNLLIRATMKHSSGTLATLGFIRVHRSAIVNPRQIREVQREGNDHVIVLRNGTRIKVGRNYVANLEL